MTLAVSVDWGKLGEAALISAAFGVGVLLVAGVAVVASLEAQDRRRRHAGGAIALEAATIACVLGILAAIVLGVYVMTQK